MKTYYPKLFTIVTEMSLWTLTWSAPIKQNHRLHLEGTTSRGYTSLTQELTLTPQFCFALISLIQEELLLGCCCLQNISAWIAGAPFQICLLWKSFTLPYNGFIFIPHQSLSTWCDPGFVLTEGKLCIHTLQFCSHRVCAENETLEIKSHKMK